MNKTFVDNDYPVDVESDIEPSLRWSNSTTSAPPAQKNGGLYGGPENRAPWMPIPVVPTSTYFMTTLLDSANPPPAFRPNRWLRHSWRRALRLMDGKSRESRG